MKNNLFSTIKTYSIWLDGKGDNFISTWEQPLNEEDYILSEDIEAVFQQRLAIMFGWA